MVVLGALQKQTLLDQQKTKTQQKTPMITMLHLKWRPEKSSKRPKHTLQGEIKRSEQKVSRFMFTNVSLLLTNMENKQHSHLSS